MQFVLQELHVRLRIGHKGLSKYSTYATREIAWPRQNCEEPITDEKPAAGIRVFMSG